MDGTGLGRPDAAHRVTPTALWSGKLARSPDFRCSAERYGRPLSSARGQHLVRLAGSFHAAVISAYLHPFKTEDAALHDAWCFSWCDAHADWLGRSLSEYQPASLVSVRDPLSVAISALFGNRPHVSCRLLARGLSHAAGLRSRGALCPR